MDIFKEKCELVEHLSRLNYETALTLAAWLVERAKKFGKSWQDKHPKDTTATADRHGYECWLEIICHVFYMALRGATGPDMGLPIESEQADIVGRITRKYDAWGCAGAIRAIYRAQGQLEANVNPGLLFESLLLECIGYERSK